MSLGGGFFILIRKVINFPRTMSIEWYDRWVETGDEGIKQRIPDDNEDDCVAMRVLVEGMRNL